MRRLIYSSTAFIGFSVVVYVALLLVANKILPERWKSNLVYKSARQQKRFTYTRLKEADSSQNADILILGASHAYRSYDIRFFSQHNWRAINIGTSAQTFVQTELLLKRYIERLKPKFVIFDVYPAMLSNDGVESGLDLIANARIDKDIVAMAFKLNDVKVYNTLICALCQKVIPGKAYTEPKKTDMGTYIKGGYVENNDKYRVIQPIVKTSYEIRKDQFTAFQNIIRMLRERKIPYALTQTPMTREKYGLITNNDSIDRVIAKYGSYYDFNKLVNIPMSGFADEHHLNQIGVNIFDGKLLSVLGDTISKACAKGTAK